MKKILTIIFIFASLFASSQELMNKNFEGFRLKVSELVIDNDTLNTSGTGGIEANKLTVDTFTVKKQIISLLPTGTPPLVVASTTKVDSLNAGLFDGKKSNEFVKYANNSSDLDMGAYGVTAGKNFKVTRSLTDLNHHAYDDLTNINITGNQGVLGYASYDVFSNVNGDTINHVHGYQSRITNNASKLINTYGYSYQFQNSGHVDFLVGLSLASPIGAGTITDKRAIFIGDYTGGYSIYSNGGDNYFRGILRTDANINCADTINVGYNNAGHPYLYKNSASYGLVLNTTYPGYSTPVFSIRSGSESDLFTFDGFGGLTFASAKLTGLAGTGTRLTTVSSTGAISATGIRVDASNNATNLTSLSFSTALGKKLSFYGDLDYMIGVQGGVLQIGANSSSDRVALGYGATGSFTEVLKAADSGVQITRPLSVSGQITSTLSTGTPPLVVASTTVVDSLNVGLLDGKKASDFQLKSDTLTFDATLSDLADSSAAIRALANTKAVISGTDNYIMKKTGVNTLGNSNLIDYGSYVNSNVPLNAPRFFAGSTNYSNGSIELGYGRIGNNYTYIDFVGDQTYTDYGLRIFRNNTGADAFSALYHRGKGDFAFVTQEAAPITFTTKSTTAVVIDTLQNSGFGTLTPAARIHSESTTTQARLGYDANKYTDLTTGSTGNLTIDPTGDTVKVVGAVNSTGGFFKNGVEITGGSGINYIGMTMPTGLSVSPANLTANGTFTISYPSGYTYFTDTERSIYSNANQKRITSASFSGTTTKTLTLSQVDGGVLQASFTDLQGSSKWTADTYGINYQSGNVGIGINSVSNGKVNISAGTNTRGIIVNSTNHTAVDGIATTGNGISGTSDTGDGVYGNSNTGYGGFFEGLGCKATKFHVISLNTAPASSTATGTTGEIRFTADYIYVCVAPNTWKRTQISTW